MSDSDHEHNAARQEATPEEPVSADRSTHKRSGVEGIAATQFQLDGHAQNWIGRVVDDRYRVTEMLGEGGMGAVFVAEHLKLHKQVALKVVRAELAGNGEVATRFAREAMATAQFEHPHVASAIDYGTLPEGGAYFVMQLVRGRSLREILEAEGKLSWQRACALGAQVADALSAARSANIIHRDLKPDNILVEKREDGSELVKILDFGIAHVAPTDAPAPEGAMAHRELTRVGTVMGTPGYMSPEQAVGDKVDHRTDLYALGVVLWECITGRELWDAPDITTVIARQMREKVPSLHDSVEDPTLPAALDRLVLALAARPVGERPDSAAEVRDSLRRLSVASIAPRALLQRVSLQRPSVEQVRETWRAQPPQRKLAIAGSLATLLVLWMVWPSDDAQPAPAAEPGSDAEKTAGADDNQANGEEDEGVIDKVVGAAKEAVEPAIEAVKNTGRGIPEDLKPEIRTMLQGDSVSERREAARRVLAYEHPERVHPHLLTIAELESARGCGQRKAAIKKMTEVGDERFLPALQRMRRFKKTGCGFLSLEDCYSCIRQDLRTAIRSITKGEDSGDDPPAETPDKAPQKKPLVQGTKR